MASDVSVLVHDGRRAAAGARPTSSSTRSTRTRRAPTPRSSSSCTTAAPATRRSTAWSSSSSTAARTTCRTRRSISTATRTDANGYFTLGNPGVPGVDLIFDPGEFGLLQNGADAVALYAGNATDFPNGTTVTTTNLQDAIVYGTDDRGRRRVCCALLNAGQPQVNENGGGSGADAVEPALPQRHRAAPETRRRICRARRRPDGANTCPPPPPPSNSVIVISQIYGGGGNAGATYQNDYVELYNRGAAPVDLTGWSLQYASATGSGWDFNKQPLGGTIGAGEYYLIALASGGANGARAAAGEHHRPDQHERRRAERSRSSTASTALVGNCPIGDPHIMDFVGYGSADCREGSTTAPARQQYDGALPQEQRQPPTPTATATTSLTGAPNPRRTAPIVELGPLVLSTDPRTNGINAPRDATIQVTFTEPVDVDRRWFDITCASSGPHNSATFAGGGQRPLHHAERQLHRRRAVHGHDLQGPGSRSGSRRQRRRTPTRCRRTTRGRSRWPPARRRRIRPSVHLTMGNPSGATPSIGQPNNYLMEKPEFALSYNRDLGRPNWVSWHLSDEWIGTLTRVDTFRPDPAGPARLVSRAVVRLLRQRLRSRPHGAERRPRQGNVDPDQPGDVPDVEHGRAGARQQPGPVGSVRELPPDARCAAERDLHRRRAAPARAARAATAA